MRCRFIVLALLALVFALVVACGDGGTNGGARTTATSQPGGATPRHTTTTAACSPAQSHAAGTSRETMTSGALQREYLLHVPASYTGSDAVPLVLNLHGYGSNMDQQAAYSDFPAKADAGGFVVVTPQGTGSPPFWNILGLATPDDVGFIRELIDTLEAQLCIDPDRVYSAGISNGAAMALRLACALSDRLAAMASVAGTTFPAGCSPDPVAVVAFHGTADPLVPYAGGPVGGGLGQRYGLTARPVEVSIADWAEHNACAAGPAREQVSEHVALLTYSRCGADVRLYTIDGGGHTWPGAIDVPRLGATSHEISATDLIWDFFEAHPHR